MAGMVYQRTLSGPKPPGDRIGHQVIDIVTCGMYNNPLMVLREYVQNAADAIEVAERKGDLRFGAGT